MNLAGQELLEYRLEDWVEENTRDGLRRIKRNLSPENMVLLWQTSRLLDFFGEKDEEQSWMEVVSHLRKQNE